MRAEDFKRPHYPSRAPGRRLLLGMGLSREGYIFENRMREPLLRCGRKLEPLQVEG